MDRIQEAIQTLNRLYPPEYFEGKPRYKRYGTYDERSKAKSLAHSKRATEEITDHYVASFISRRSSLTYKELRQQPELLDAYRQNLKIKRLLKQQS